MDSFRSLRVSVYIGCLLIAATGLHAHSRAFVPAAAGTAVPPDTIEQSVEAGSVLITALPAPADESEVTYEVIQAPALSWLVDRSFFWNTRPQDAGNHLVVFHRRSEARSDTLVLSVDLTR